MNKIKLLVFLFFFSVLTFSQNADTAAVSPPAPSKIDTTTNQAQPGPTPENNNQNIPQKKYPKGFAAYQKDKSSVKEPPAYLEKLYYGCNLALRFYSRGGYNVFYYDVSPHIGYKFNEYMSGGLQIIYNNSVLTYGSTRVSYNIVGVGVFARALVTKNLFIQAEYDYLSVPENYLGTAIAHRAESDEKMAGLGYKSMWGEKLSYFLTLMYDFQPTLYSPYYQSPLVYRAGLVWNF
jgi:hypothetical protein